MSYLKNMLVGLVLLFSFGLSSASEASSTQSSQVIATVYDVQITFEHLDMIYQRIYDETNGSALRESRFKEILDRVIEKEILAQHHSASYSMDDSSEVDVIAARASKMYKILYEEVDITEHQIQQYLGNNSQYKASHILVKSKVDAAGLITRLNSGEDFSSLARSFSQDPSAGTNGGDLGWFFPDMMVLEFSQAATQMEVGSISTEPVKTQHGWHVIKLDKKQFRSSYDEKSKNFIVYVKKREMVQGKIKELREDAAIVINWDALNDELSTTGREE